MHELRVNFPRTLFCEHAPDSENLLRIQVWQSRSLAVPGGPCTESVCNSLNAFFRIGLRLRKHGRNTRNAGRRAASRSRVRDHRVPAHGLQSKSSEEIRTLPSDATKHCTLLLKNIYRTCISYESGISGFTLVLRAFRFERAGMLRARIPCRFSRCSFYKFASDCESLARYKPNWQSGLGDEPAACSRAFACFSTWEAFELMQVFLPNATKH
jgi:hypothetical protein